MHKNTASIIDNVLIGSGIVILMFCMNYYFYGDGAQRYIAIKSLANAGQLLPTRYSLIGPMFSFPLLWIEKALNIPPVLTVRYNFFLFLAALVLLNYAFKNTLPERVIKRFILILLIGSMFTNNVRFYHGEVFTAVMVATGFALVNKSRLAWGLTVAGVVNTPATIIGYSLVMFCEAWKSRRIRYFMILAICAVLIFLETLIRMGKLGVSGYENDNGFKTLMPYSGMSGFSYPWFFGIISIIFSFGKGLIFFSPGLLLPIFGSNDHGISSQIRKCYGMWMLFLCGMILVYAKWWAWYGGWSFGPRFFLFASIPASLALAIHLEQPPDTCIKNILLLAVLALSLWVGISGAVFHLDKLEIGQINRYALEHVVWHVPEFSVLWHPFVERRELNWQDYIILAYGVIVFLYLGFPNFVKIFRQLSQGLIEIKKTLFVRNWKI